MFSVDASDFPLVIRRVRANDTIQMRFGNKNVHRFFVDRKSVRYIENIGWLWKIMWAM